MKYLKNHLSLILALVSILFSMEIYFIFTKVVENYSKKIASNYSIIIVSQKPIKALQFPDISKVEAIDITPSLKKLTNNLEGFDLKEIESQLPYFYRVYFNHFPSPKEVALVTQKLKQYPYIKKVEDFKTNQNKIYNLLLLLKTISSIFMFMTFFIAFLVIIKQMEIWKLEHEERMYIMDLFGAPFLLKSGVLLRLAITDSIISTIIIAIILFLGINSNSYTQLINQLGIKVDVNIFMDIITFLAISLFISLISVIIVIVSNKKSEN